jgi:SMP-30/Gluconolactonase/LRE-like region
LPDQTKSPESFHHIGLVAQGDVVDADEHLVASLLVPNLPARIATVGQDGTNRRLRPPPVACQSIGVWADLGPGSAPDGICADAEGAIWYASVPGQRCTRVAEGGEVLDTVMADRGCVACMLGGDDARTLVAKATFRAHASHTEDRPERVGAMFGESFVVASSCPRRRSRGSGATAAAITR